MREFDAFLTRSFAESEHPADDGFAVRVGAAVARHERGARLRAGLNKAGMGVAVAVVGYVALGAMFGLGQDLLAGSSLEVTRGMAELEAGAPALGAQAEAFGTGVFQSLGLGMTQILLIAGALVGGAVAYRSTQE
jgi:hypothetical protein